MELMPLQLTIKEWRIYYDTGDTIFGKTIEEWNKMQIKFIEFHHYFTDTAKELRNVKKNEQLQIIRKMV